MRKLVAFLLIPFLFSCEKEISEKQSDYFLKFYGTYMSDIASQVRELPDGGYVITGTSETESRGTDISLVFTDKYGRQIGETKYFGNSWDDKSNGLDIYDEGLLISGGISNSDETLDAVLIQTDFSGNIVGNIHNYGGVNNDEAYASIQKDDGGFFFVGYTNSLSSSNQLYIVSYDENFANPKVSANESGIQIALKNILKFRENQYFSAGTRVIGGSINSSQISILFINEAGNYVVAGDFGDPLKANEFASMVQQNDSTLFVLSTLKEGSSTVGKLNVRKIVYKLDPFNPGKILYMKERENFVLSDNAIFNANDLTLNKDGNLVVLGTKTVSLDKKIVLMIVDESGNKIGETKEFGSTGEQTASSVICSDEGILILGNNKYGENSMFTLIKTDAQGNLWE
ncbi:MAG: hypothetical protein K9H49_13130 [Bacteroidales bacterium]|nr:hypothetical protein [Bacteroidales bacterium]